MEYYSGFKYGENPPLDKFLEKGEPFYLKHEKKVNTIVLCLHGFTAAPFETLPVAKKCYGRGMDVVGPVIPAHCISNTKDATKAMGDVSWKEWVQAARSEIEIARKNYKNVFIYGQSMGGAIAVLMAEENLVDAMAVTAPAIILPKYLSVLWILGWLKLNVPKFGDKSTFLNIAYEKFNIHATKQLLLLSRKARAQLNKITCPVIEFHSEIDNLVSPKAAHLLKEKVSGPIEIKWYNDSGHTMPLDVNGEEITNDIAEFFIKKIL